MPRDRRSRQRKRPRGKNQPVNQRSGTLVQQQRVGARLTQQMRAELYSGSLPHPELLERFEAIHPGATDRFFTMAEKQAEHRQIIEKKFLTVQSATQIIGALFAGIVMLLGMYLGYDMIMHDKKVEGYAAMLTPLGTIALAFIGVKISNAIEKRRKASVEGR